MALFKKKKAQKGKPTKNKIAKRAATASTVGSVAKVAKVGGKVGTLAKYAGIAGAVVGGAVLVEKAAEKLGVRGGAGFIGKRGTKSGKRRRGSVPKTVRRWASKMASRRKTEENIVRKLFGTGGGKIIKAPKRAFGGRGVITAAEAREALRT